MTFRHYNAKKLAYPSDSLRFGCMLRAEKEVGINFDVHFGAHTFSFWFYPTAKYGRVPFGER